LVFDFFSSSFLRVVASFDRKNAAATLLPKRRRARGGTLIRRRHPVIGRSAFSICEGHLAHARRA
jgi:hypothetical protein